MIHLAEGYYTEQLDKKIKNAQVQGIIGNEILFTLNHIEQQYYQLVTTTKPQARKLISNNTADDLKQIRHLVEVLENGGAFSQSYKLNLSNKESVNNTLIYAKDEQNAFPELQISLIPKLKNIEDLFAKTNTLLNQQQSIKEQNYVSLDTLNELNRLAKNAEPIFIRVAANVNRIQYEQQQRFVELEANIATQKRSFKIGLYSSIIFILSLGLLLFLVISQHIQKMTQALQTEKDNALRATESKSIFLANMSHEIRTPLNAITGFIALLKDSESDRHKLRQLDIIDNSSRNLLSIINDILDFSKIESNKLEFDFIDFNPAQEFAAIAELFKAKCSEKNITLVADISEDLPESLHSDPLRIKQVVSNLLSNAIKFSAANKSVRLEIKYDAAFAELSVAVIDQGIGISKSKQQQIFEAFSQAEASTTRQFGGTGLGLSISSLLVELLGGSLHLESEENVGSKFFFTLPIKQGKPIPKKLQKNFKKVTKHGVILLVEDNKTNQVLMGAILKKMQVKFDLAEDGLQAVEAFQKRQYDLILMDENMPNMSGSEATKKIRELEKLQQSNPPIAIVALTANAMKGDRERFLAAGMDDYLTKPLQIAELNRVINQYLVDSE